MKKKQVKEHFWQSWWFKMIILPVILMPAVVLSWKNLTLIWAAPESLGKVEKKVLTHEEVQQKLSMLLVEQQSRLDKQEEIDRLQVDSLKEQLALVVQMKKEKK